MGQDPNFTLEKNDMLSIMHFKNAFWISLLFKIFVDHNCYFLEIGHILLIFEHPLLFANSIHKSLF